MLDPVHEEHRAMWHAYGEAICKAKWEHWTAFIKDLSYSDIWIANCYASSDAGDGGGEYEECNQGGYEGRELGAGSVSCIRMGTHLRLARYRTISGH